MEIHHKVKPLHGWRAFLGEVGIIVLGVLLALGAEQVVEMLHWRHRVELGRETISDDFATLLFNAGERKLFAPCIDRQLNDVRAILAEASERGRLPAVGEITPPLRRPWHLTSWEGLAAAQVATHFPREELLSYTKIADFGDAVDRINEDELRAWTALSMLSGTGRRLSDAEAVQLRLALAQADWAAKLMNITADQMRQYVEASGGHPEEAAMHELRTELAKRSRELPGSPRCKALRS